MEYLHILNTRSVYYLILIKFLLVPIDEMAFYKVEYSLKIQFHFDFKIDWRAIIDLIKLLPRVQYKLYKIILSENDACKYILLNGPHFH